MGRKKTVEMIIAVACAFALWAYVTTAINPPETRTISGVSVELTGLDTLAADGLTVASGSFAVDVVVEGSRSDVSKLTSEDFTATADMSNFPLGENSVEVKVTGPDLMTITEIHPDRIQVNVEELISASRPVKLSYTKKFPEGMEPGFITVVPAEIEISGTKTDVDSVSYVRAEIDSTQIREDERAITADAVPVDNSGDRVIVTTSQNSVEVRARLCYVKEVPLDIEIKGRPPGALAVTREDVPDKVTIRGSKDAIEDIERVSAAPIDINNLRSTSIITPELDLPEDVELADASRNLAVTIEIGGEEAKSFTVTNDKIEVKGLPEGYSAHIATGSVNVTVFGSHEQIKDFTADDLKLFIDLSTMDLTQNQIKAIVDSKSADKYKRLDIAPVAVDVTITQLPGTATTPETAPDSGTATDSATESAGMAEGGTEEA
jgi:YbbR domain-containing protein